MKQTTNILSYDDFSQEDKNKIEKRMSVEFIEEYIKYINARNAYNDPPHSKEELKQKVIDYAKHANIDQEDNKEITENHHKINNDIKQQNPIGRGNDKNIYKIGIPKTKKQNKKIIVAQKKFSDSEQVYSNESIAISALLSLMERQPKYYTHQTMEVVNTCPDDSVNIGLIGDAKNNARKLMFPIRDDASFNSYLIQDKENNNIRMSRIDIDKTSATLPRNIFECLDEQYIALNKQVKEDDNRDIMQLCKELLKNLSITPELIKLSVTQHLKSIGCNDEDIKDNIKLAIRIFTYHLQCLQLMRILLRTDEIPQKSELRSQGRLIQDYKFIKQFMSNWQSQHFCNSRHKLGYSAWTTKLKKMFTDKTNDINDKLMKKLNQQFNEKLDKTIEKFTNYISLQDKIENKVNKIIEQNPALSDYKERIAAYLQKEIDKGKNIKEIKVVKYFTEEIKKSEQELKRKEFDKKTKKRLQEYKRKENDEETKKLKTSQEKTEKIEKLKISRKYERKELDKKINELKNSQENAQKEFAKKINKLKILQEKTEKTKNFKSLQKYALKHNNPTLYWKVMTKQKQQRDKKHRHNLHYGEQGWGKLSNIEPKKAINTNFGIGRK